MSNSLRVEDMAVAFNAPTRVITGNGVHLLILASGFQPQKEAVFKVDKSERIEARLVLPAPNISPNRNQPVGARTSMLATLTMPSRLSEDI